MSSLLEIAQAVATGALPMETAEALILAAFPALPPDLVQRILAGLRSFTPREQGAAGG